MDPIKRIKDAAKLVQALGNVEVSRKMIAVQADFLELLEKNRQLQDEIHELREQLQRERRTDKLLSRRTHRNNAYWIGDAPYCTGCWDDKDKPVRLTVYGNGHAKCPVCKANVRVDPEAAEQHSIRASLALSRAAEHHRRERHDHGAW